MDFELWRSREIRFLKPRKDSQGRDIYVSKDGKTYPAEIVKKEWERLEDMPPHG